MQYPPIANNKTVTKFTTSAPKKYPATDEKTTLMANRIFVISLKSESTDIEGVCTLVLLKKAILYLAQRYFLIVF
jgi:hypothetical protein